MSIRIENLRASIGSNRYSVTDHADEEAASDALAINDVLESMESGEIIEQYPDDRPFPSCLVLGRTSTTEPAHSVWAYDVSTEWAMLITVYRPDPARWIDLRVRKQKT